MYDEKTGIHLSTLRNGLNWVGLQGHFTNIKFPSKGVGVKGGGKGSNSTVPRQKKNEFP